MSKIGKKVIGIALFSILFSAICLLISFAIYKNDRSEEAYSEVSSSLPTVVIDAGHGGQDGGASAPDGTLEKDINLEIALTLDEILKANGIKTVLTRSGDFMLDAGEKNSGKKMNDLLARVRTAEQTENCVFISIHANKFSQSKYKGLQVFYSPNSEKSKALADKIQTCVKSFLEPENERESKDPGSTVFILEKLECPSVLIECGFLSNEEDVRLLCDEEFRKKLCCSISNSVIEFLNDMC